jgi:hypothetical protein
VIARLRKGAVINVFLLAGIGLLVYYATTLTEGEVRDGDARSVKRAFTPRGSISAKQDLGASPSVNVRARGVKAARSAVTRQELVRFQPRPSERAAFEGSPGQRTLAAAPPAIRKDAGTARSVNVAYHRHSYPVDFRHRWILEKAHRLRTNTKLKAEHAHVQRLLDELRHARHVQAHVEASVAWPWVAIADCESGDGDGQPPYTADWTYNGASGFDGGVQFEPDTWSSYRRAGDPEYAYEASPDVQLAVAERVLADQGWRAWPACSRKVGLR